MPSVGFASEADSRSLGFDSSSSVTLSVGYELQHKHVSLDTAVSKIFARSRTLKEAHHK